MNANIKRKILENLGPLIWISLILSLAIVPATIYEHTENQEFKQLSGQLSQTQSTLKIQSATVNLQLSEDSFIYDEQGGVVTGDSQVSFNKESNNLSFKISYPISTLKRDSTTVELSSERNKNTYQIKQETHSETVTSIKLLISGLDTSLNWYLNQTKVNPSENGELEIELTPQSDWLVDTKLQVTKTLIGYSPKDNSIQDGIILKYIP